VYYVHDVYTYIYITSGRAPDRLYAGRPRALNSRRVVASKAPKLARESVSYTTYSVMYMIYIYLLRQGARAVVRWEAARPQLSQDSGIEGA